MKPPVRPDTRPSVDVVSDAAGVMAGVEPGQGFSEAAPSLGGPGDKLVLMTDGITETRRGCS